jgi:hypothetical protein
VKKSIVDNIGPQEHVIFLSFLQISQPFFKTILPSDLYTLSLSLKLVFTGFIFLALYGHPVAEMAALPVVLGKAQEVYCLKISVRQDFFLYFLRLIQIQDAMNQPHQWTTELNS